MKTISSHQIKNMALEANVTAGDTYVACGLPGSGTSGADHSTNWGWSRQKWGNSTSTGINQEGRWNQRICWIRKFRMCRVQQLEKEWITTPVEIHPDVSFPRKSAKWVLLRFKKFRQHNQPKPLSQDFTGRTESPRGGEERSGHSKSSVNLEFSMTILNTLSVFCHMQQLFIEQVLFGTMLYAVIQQWRKQIQSSQATGRGGDRQN